MGIVKYLVLVIMFLCTTKNSSMSEGNNESEYTKWIRYSVTGLCSIYIYKRKLFCQFRVNRTPCSHYIIDLVSLAAKSIFRYISTERKPPVLIIEWSLLPIRQIYICIAPVER